MGSTLSIGTGDGADTVTLSRVAVTSNLQIETFDTFFDGDDTVTITVGAIVEPLMMNDGTGVRVSQDFINKLPF